MTGNAMLEATVEARQPPGAGAKPYVEALDCLRDANVPFAVLRDDPGSFAGLRDLDLLVAAGEMEIAAAALQRAGFVGKKQPGLEHKWVFIRYESGRFYVLDVHGALVQNGYVYMSAKLAFERLDLKRTYPRLCSEDLFLHLALHHLLGKAALQDKHVAILRTLRLSRLDRTLLDAQVGPFGLQPFLESLLQIDALDPSGWKDLRARVQRALSRSRHRTRRPSSGIWARLRAPRPVIVALLGPDGCGKTTLMQALEVALAGSPLVAASVYMGAWGHDRLPMRFIRRLIPPRISHRRILAAVRGRPVALTPEEQQFVADVRPGRWGQLARAVRYTLKEAFFYGGLAAELWYRYLRSVRLSRRPVVLADRWVYDLELRQGRTPFTYGDRVRRWIYRLFPTPDGILYLSAPYAVVEARKPQLDRELFIDIDAHWRRFLKPLKPLDVITDLPADEIAQAFVRRYWETLLDRHNSRAPARRSRRPPRAAATP
jgi:thymidylate kinase